MRSFPVSDKTLVELVIRFQSIWMDSTRYGLVHFKRSNAHLAHRPTLQSHLKIQNKAADERLNRRGKVGTPDLASSRICQMKGGGSGVGCSPEHAWPNTSNAPLPTIYTTCTHCWPTKHQNIYTIRTHTHTGSTISVLKVVRIHTINVRCHQKLTKKVY